jgi:hypothetical protein
MTGDMNVTQQSLGFEDLPGDVNYTKVRIKSNVPYPVKEILWRNYNLVVGSQMTVGQHNKSEPRNAAAIIRDPLVLS